MKKISLSLWVLSALILGNTNQVRSQGLPVTQPKLLTIVREEVKVGRSAEHARHEAGWPATYEKVKSPDYYLAMTSLTGPNEAWYISPWESHAAIATSMKRDDKNPVLSAELDRLALADAEYISAVRTIQAQARTDLSVGAFPDLAKARFFEIRTTRVRHGHEGQFEAASKAYRAAMKRIASKFSFGVYEVIAGMPTPTFLIITSVEDYAEFDGLAAALQNLEKALTAEEQAGWSKRGATWKLPAGR